jgi:hypothetical protein
VNLTSYRALGSFGKELVSRKSRARTTEGDSRHGTHECCFGPLAGKVPDENATAMRLCVRHVGDSGRPVDAGVNPAREPLKGIPGAGTPKGDSRHGTQSACATQAKVKPAKVWARRWALKFFEERFQPEAPAGMTKFA